ncbi:tropomyosin, putative [Ixodes scapularis]|uniref:Tropomyosin, putative n=1 Tax=Ixodes scapularis TaxID=6945 RepID=B7PMB8_IXOSC|nr:tropomyosin, putative [Ixodes scapularis]|eukprot:XP_002434916.1 tropomyosin, putative [Ixodes scapularis]
MLLLNWSGAEDALVLKQELVSVQRAMDQLTLEREVERDKLKAENALLMEQSRAYREEKASLEEALLRAPRQEEIDSLRAALDDRSSSSGALQQALQQHMVEVKELRGTLKQRESRDGFKTEAWEKQMKVEELTRQLEARESKMSDQEEELTKIKESLVRLEAERAELYAKIESGEGASTLAMQQLTQENASLQDQVLALEKASERASQEHDAKVESLHQQLQESKTQLQAAMGEQQKLEKCCRDLEESQTSSRSREHKLEEDLKRMSESLSAAEATSATRLSELEKSKAKLEEYAKEASQLAEKVQLLTSELHSKRGECSDLESGLAEEKQRVARAESKSASLEDKLGAKCQALATMTAEKQTLQLKVEEANKRLSEARTSANKVSSGVALLGTQN